MRNEYLVALLLVVFACDGSYKIENEKVIVATVGEKHLYASDLPKTTATHSQAFDDSVKQSREYIQQWVHQELMLMEAERSLTPEQKDVSRELEEYRASLVVHRYQQEMVKRLLDTVVTKEDIADFYAKFPEKFMLNNNVVKCVYIKVPKSVADTAHVKSLILSEKEESIKKLEEYSIQYATKFGNFSEQWVNFSVISYALPVEINDQAVFLRKNKHIEVDDDIFYYFVAIKDFRLRGEEAPYNFMENQIENLILNRRKIELINKLDKDIYDSGRNRGKFTIKD